MLDHEIAELRHGIRDLAALSTLPGAWNSCDPERIADSIAAALVTMLDAEFVYVSLRGRQDMPVVEVTRTRDHAFLGWNGIDWSSADPMRVVRKAMMAEGLRDPFLGRTAEVPHPSGAEIIRVCSAPIGFGGDATLVTGSRHESFPSEVQRLLLGVGAVQAAHAIRRWRAETEARRFVMLVESSSDFIGFASLDGTPQYINPKGLKLVGLDGPEDIVGRHALDFFTSEDRARVRDEVLPTAMRSGRWVGEIGFRHFKTGATIPFLVDCFRIDDPRTGLPMNIATVSRDLKAQKRTEAELRRYAAIVESSNDAIIGTTLDGVITTWNRAAETIFGYRSEEAVGRPVTLLGAMDRKDEIPRILQRIRLGEQLEHFETVRRRKDGVAVAVSLTISPIRDADGTIVGASKIARDITERKRAEAALRHLNGTLEQRVANRTTELEEANARLRLEMAERARTDARLQEVQSELFHAARLSAVGQMAAALAHELNQPLAAATNFVKAGQRQLADKGGYDMIREDLEDAAAQVLRAGQIIRRLREFVTRGETERRVESVAGMVQEASALTLNGAGALGVDVRFRFDPRAVQAFVNRVQVQQVIINLIRNGLEATIGLGRRELEVSTACLDEDMVEITVGDNGPGLVADVRDHLFEPFISTKRNGMGLGLSVCRSIVEAHGARRRDTVPLHPRCSPAEGGQQCHLNTRRSTRRSGSYISWRTMRPYAGRSSGC
jgi:PAS domain S-box-containing protein